MTLYTNKFRFLTMGGGIFASYGIGQIASSEFATCVKEFLIQVSDKTTGEAQLFVVTLFTEKSYADLHPDFDYLNRPNYTGVVLFSNVLGEFNGVNVYNNGRILPAKRVMNPEQLTDDSVYYVSVFFQSETKGGVNEEIITHWDGSPSYCFAYVVEASYCYGVVGSIGSGNGTDVGGSTPGGGLNAPVLSPYPVDLENPLLPKELKHVVRVSTNCPEDIKLLLEEDQHHYDYSVPCLIPGETIAEYTEGSYVSVHAEYITENPTHSLDDFSHWTGFFRDFDTDYIVFKVLCDINSTAYYNSNTPCHDRRRGITNPLFDMIIAPSGLWKNYKGGTFGLTRKTLQEVDSTMVWVKRRHDGIDLKADPGTPVYSLYNGVIVRAYSDAPNHYSRGFGNELRIRCVNKSGDVFVVQYAHLNYGTPFAINPRTGNTFTVNDQVFQGDLIGYTGKTGNAFKDSDVPVKHLHLGIQSNGEWVDPKNYINGTIDTTKIFNGIITNIHCD